MLLLYKDIEDETAVQRNNHLYTAPLMNGKKALHTTECFYFLFTNVPSNDCTLDQLFKLTEHTAGMETFNVQLYQLFCSLLVLI